MCHSVQISNSVMYAVFVKLGEVTFSCIVLSEMGVCLRAHQRFYYGLKSPPLSYGKLTSSVVIFSSKGWKSSHPGQSSEIKSPHKGTQFNRFLFVVIVIAPA